MNEHDRPALFLPLILLASVTGLLGAVVALTEAFLPGLALMVLASFLPLVGVARARRLERARNDDQLRRLVAGERDAEHATLAREGEAVDAP